jgi:hypothetical protein
MSVSMNVAFSRKTRVEDTVKKAKELARTLNVDWIKYEHNGVKLQVSANADELYVLERYHVLRVNNNSAARVQSLYLELD